MYYIICVLGTSIFKVPRGSWQARGVARSARARPSRSRAPRSIVAPHWIYGYPYRLPAVRLMSKPSRSAVISTLSAADLPWENLGEQQQNESAPTKVRHLDDSVALMHGIHVVSTSVLYARALCTHRAFGGGGYLGQRQHCPGS